MTDRCHIKNRFDYISTIYCPINAKFGMKKHNHFQTGHITQLKFREVKMADGRHFEKVLSLYLRWESSDFNEIWCADANFGSKNGHMTKYHNFWQIQNGGRAKY